MGCFKCIAYVRYVQWNATNNKGEIRSTPDRIRTCDPQLRRLLLYPAELPGHVIL